MRASRAAIQPSGEPVPPAAGHPLGPGGAPLEGSRRSSSHPDQSVSAVATARSVRPIGARHPEGPIGEEQRPDRDVLDQGLELAREPGRASRGLRRGEPRRPVTASSRPMITTTSGTAPAGMRSTASSTTSEVVTRSLSTRGSRSFPDPGDLLAPAGQPAVHEVRRRGHDEDPGDQPGPGADRAEEGQQQDHGDRGQSAAS